MKVETVCINCLRYYRFDDDNGDLLSEGCKLDIPLFDNRKPIICNSYRDRK